jgi:hypothetical protein
MREPLIAHIWQTVDWMRSQERMREAGTPPEARWFDRARERLEWCRRQLPSGSGFDAPPTILTCTARSPTDYWPDNRVVIEVPFHFRSERGHSWWTFRMIARPVFHRLLDLDVVRGRAAPRWARDPSMIDYLHEVYISALRTECEEPPYK